MNKEDLGTKEPFTWCPGCPNFQIMEGVKKAVLAHASKTGNEKFAMVSGIGCHAKIFDYLNFPGLNSLHGRVLPTCLGLKVGDPTLNVIGFTGDGDSYSEGISHLIHAARYNSDFKVIVHNNQVFALTVGQPTATTEMGFMDKTTFPFGSKQKPLNPVKLMLASGATFVARTFADIEQTEWVLKEALKHKGFAFIEILQPCITFHPDKGYKEKTYSLEKTGHDKTNLAKAMAKAEEFDYNTVKKIPTGIFYQESRETFEDKFPQLVDLRKKGISWKDIKR